MDELKQEMDSEFTDPARANKIREEFRKRDDEICRQKLAMALAEQTVARPFEFTEWESLLHGYF